MRGLLLATIATAVLGCNAVVRGSKLSNVPVSDRSLFMSTGGAPTPYRTLGFIQVRGYGVEVAGYADVGDAQLDGTIKGTLAQEASKMGGNGVIHIEFYDENPSTDIERASAAYNSIGGMLSGKGPESKARYVTVSGEVVLLNP